jgi:hypothetical protein
MVSDNRRTGTRRDERRSQGSARDPWWGSACPAARGGFSGGRMGGGFFGVWLGLLFWVLLVALLVGIIVWIFNAAQRR